MAQRRPKLRRRPIALTAATRPSIGDLVRETDAGVFLGDGAADGGCADACGITLDLELIGSDDHDDAVDATAPICEKCLAFAASAGIAFNFEDQSRLDYGYGCGIGGEAGFHPLALGGDDGRMDDGVQFIESPTLKSEGGEAGAGEATGGCDDVGAEGTDDFGIDLLARFHEGAAQVVGFDDVCAQFAQNACDGALAAA